VARLRASYARILYTYSWWLYSPWTRPRCVIIQNSRSGHVVVSSGEQRSLGESAKACYLAHVDVGPSSSRPREHYTFRYPRRALPRQAHNMTAPQTCSLLLYPKHDGSVHASLMNRTMQLTCEGVGNDSARSDPISLTLSLELCPYLAHHVDALRPIREIAH
jgi:hypothetical protein